MAQKSESCILMKTALKIFIIAGSLCAFPAQALFKCVDEKGVTHYGDTMPPQCAAKPVSEMNKQGLVVKKYEPPPTPEQLKAQSEEKALRAENTKKVNAQRRKDKALLGTYDSEREFDVARDREIAQLDMRIKNLSVSGEDADKKMEKLNTEMEFYKAGKGKHSKAREIPPQLVSDFSRVQGVRGNIDVEIERIEEEKRTIAARYEADKVRWQRLTAGMTPGTILNEKGEVLIAAEPEKKETVVVPAKGH